MFHNYSRPSNKKIGTPIPEEFPIMQEINASDGSPNAGLPDDAKKRILVVDDEDTIRELSESILKKKGYHVETASDGETAQAMIEGNSYDLVIADVSASCGCTVPSFPKTAIRPGEEGVVKVSFDSRGRKGFQSKSLLVVANTQPNVTQLKIRAEVVKPGD